MLDKIITYHRPQVIRYITSLLITPDPHIDAEDVCAKAELIAYTKFTDELDSLDTIEDEFIRFFYGCAKWIAKETNRNYLRHQHLIQSHASDIEKYLFGNNGHASIPISVFDIVYRLAGRYLSERERHILELHYNEEYTFLEIAKMLHINHDNVRKIHERSIKKIREIINRFLRPDGPGGGQAMISIESDYSEVAITLIKIRRLPQGEKAYYVEIGDYEINLPARFFEEYVRHCRTSNSTMLTSFTVKLLENIQKYCAVFIVNEEMYTSILQLINILKDMDGIRKLPTSYKIFLPSSNILLSDCYYLN